MTEQEVKDMLVDMGYEDTILFTSPAYADAFIGVTSNGIAMYDRTMMIKCLMDEDGMTEEDAIEWIDYNCCCCGDGYPMVIDIMNPCYAQDVVEPDEAEEASSDESLKVA